MLWSSRRRGRAGCALLRSLHALEKRQLLAAQVLGSETMYPTIQAAVDAAPTGATVVVEPGVYPELVFIWRSMTVRGAHAGVDARSSFRGTGETIVNGTPIFDGVTSSFVINADNVTLDGFTVQGNTSTTRFGAGIVLGANTSGSRIVNNIVQNNISGLYLANNSASNATVIEKNLFRDNNQVGQHSGRGIYTDGTYTNRFLTNVTINDNAFLRNFGGAGTTRLEAAVDIHAQVTSIQNNIRITNNAFDDNGKTLLAVNASQLLISGNAITSTRDTRSGALRFEGNVNNVAILNNLLYNNIARAIRIDNNLSPGPNFGFTINGNNIYRNATDFSQGVFKDGLAINAGQYDGTLNAENNWWGHASGPSGDGPGSGDAIYANGNSVDFTPWSTTPQPNQQIPYFARAFTTGERIDAVYFDHGGQGVSYHDIDTPNLGQQLRKREFVDIQPASDAGAGAGAGAGSGYNIGWIRPGEWLEYSVDVATSGTYSFDFRVASAQSVGGNFRILIDDAAVPGSVTIPGTGGFQNWRTITKTNVALSAGRRVIRLAFDTSGSGASVGNLNWLQINPQPPATLTSSDIGITGIAGSTINNAGVYTLKGAGADIWGNEDAFHFAYRQLTGNFELIARVTSIEQGDIFAKAGLDIRESLAANAKHAGLYLTPGAGVRFIRRTSSGGGSVSTPSAIAGPITLVWLKLARNGNTITASRSADGSNWTVIGTQTLTMGQGVFVGLAVTSKRLSSPLTATFDNVSVVA